MSRGVEASFFNAEEAEVAEDAEIPEMDGSMCQTFEKGELLDGQSPR